VGSQHPNEGFRTQTKPRAKFNKDVKIRKADFYLNLSLKAKDFTRTKCGFHLAQQDFTFRQRRNISLRPKGALG
jgi:hypothetical protein